MMAILGVTSGSSWPVVNASFCLKNGSLKGSWRQTVDVMNNVSSKSFVGKDMVVIVDPVADCVTSIE